MWILESNGDFLQGKRMWLRPGRKYLFGRVKKDGVQFAIDEKTVSRKHFIIEVDEVVENEVSQPLARTKIKVIDQSSKSGTTVNGFTLKGGNNLSKELLDTQNSVRPGNLDHELIIRWQPCVLTVHLLKKEIKAGALKTKQDRLRLLGVKAIQEFVQDATTHVIATKRNTPKGLQALIAGKFLVTDSYIDALEYAATPTTLDDDEDASPLECDFDKAWPATKDHLPPPGREPTLRPVESYQPGPDRSEIFKDYTFVFGDQSQYDNLLPAITTGHGKALLFKLVNGETGVDEAYDFMSKAAGRKGFGDPADENERGGAVMVQWNAPPEHLEWAKTLIQHLALKLDQRAIDQSEFLDAILANDAALLRQSLPQESTTDGKVAPPPSLAQSFASIRQFTQARPTGNAPGTQINGSTQRRSQEQPQAYLGPRSQPSIPENTQNGDTEASPATETPLKPFRERFKKPPPTQKAFDDGFDPDAIIEYDEDEEAEVPSHIDDSEAEADVAKSETTFTRKRRRSPSPDPEQDLADDMDKLYPAATALKKRKLELEAEARRKGLPVPTTSSAANGNRSKKRKEVELDVREIARAQRQKEAEEERREAERDDQLPPHDENDREPANLVNIEYMDIPVRSSKPVAPNNPEDDPRWDHRWDGRKNFKKFRPQQANTTRTTNHATKVIVPLVEAKKNTGGLGDQYWGKSAEDRAKEKKRKNKERSQRTQSSGSQGQTQMHAQSTSGRASRSTRPEVISDDEEAGEQDPRQTSPAATRLQEEAAAIVDHEIDMDSPRRTRGDDVRSQTQRATTQTQSAPTQSPSSTRTQQGTKRAPARQSGATKKRQKTLPVTTIHGSDSEGDSDDMKFQFGRRGKKAKS